MAPTIDTSQWPALQVELVPIADLIPYIRNPRQHSPEQIAQIASSMMEFGWTIPVLRDEDGVLIAGHGRILAARKLEWDVAPVTTARGWSESKKRAYRIADNKLTINSTWDIDLLNTEIEALAEEEFPLDLTGFNEADLARLADDLMANQFTEAQQPAQDPPQDGNGAAPRSAPDQVSLVIPMTVAQREGIFEAIQKAKRDYGLDQSAEALWQICRTYLEQE
jgi:hypothetical protein